MSGTKIVVIVLVVLAILYVVLAVRGAKKNESKKGKDPETEIDASRPEPGSLRGKVSEFLSSKAPKLKVEDMRPMKTTFSLGSEDVVILQDEDETELRQAKFRLNGTPGCVQMEYRPPGDDGKDQKLNPQSWPQEGADKQEVTFTILKRGGTLKFLWMPVFTGVCTVQMQ